MFVFAGCSFSDSVKSITVLGYNEAIVVEIGKFDYNNYKIAVNYANGSYEEVDLTEEMISSYDQLKFYQVGEQTINITYKNCSCEVKLNVQRIKLDNIIFEDKTVVYTGNSYTLEVEGDIPADVNIRYPKGNSFTDVGTYEITAICYGDKYETKTIFATLTIEYAQYDMSNVKFEDATFVYDKSPKSISVSGTLPEGVSVEYKIDNKKGNSVTDAGEYEVVANFYSKNANYAPIPSMKAKLKINKAKYADFDITFSDKNVVYSGHSNFIEANLTNVPNGVSTYYTIQKIKNARGESAVGATENGNSAILAGTYIVTINFKVADVLNYEEIASKSAILFIDRAVYVVDNAFMYSKSVVFDGQEKSISLSGKVDGQQPILPFGVEIAYTCKMIEDATGKEVDGASVSGNSAKNAGTYEIIAHLTSADENYKEIEDIVGFLEITQATYENLNLTMNNLSVNYDGNSHSILVDYSNLPETVTIRYTIKKIYSSNGEEIVKPVESEGNCAIDAGTYEITAIFENTDDNYSEISSLTATLVILGVE